MPKVERRGLRATAPSTQFQPPAPLPEEVPPAPVKRRPRAEVVQAARELDFSSLPRDEVRVAYEAVRGAGAVLSIDGNPVVRDGRLYARGDSWGFLESDRSVVVKFPAEFPVPELAGVTVAAKVFAERGGEYPFWAEFLHPLDGRKRSVILGRDWVLSG